MPSLLAADSAVSRGAGHTGRCWELQISMPTREFAWSTLQVFCTGAEDISPAEVAGEDSRFDNYWTWLFLFNWSSQVTLVSTYSLWTLSLFALDPGGQVLGNVYCEVSKSHLSLWQTVGCCSCGEKKNSCPDHQPLRVNKHCILTVFHLTWDSSPTFSQQVQSHIGNYMREDGREKQREADGEEERRGYEQDYSAVLCVCFILTLCAHLIC